MIPFLFILGCVSSDEPDPTKSDIQKAETPNTDSVLESTNSNSSPSVLNTTNTEIDAAEANNQEIETFNEVSQYENNLKKNTTNELIPSPNIDGMVKKEKKQSYSC